MGYYEICSVNEMFMENKIGSFDARIRRLFLWFLSKIIVLRE